MELRKRDLAACVAGNALEFYDFTTYAYFAECPSNPTSCTGGYLESVTRAGSVLASYTYDSARRVRTVTHSDGYSLVFDYDAIDRPTRVTYPDATRPMCTVCMGTHGVLDTLILPPGVDPR